MKSIRLPNRHQKGVRLDYIDEKDGYLRYKGNDCFQWRYCGIHSTNEGEIIAIDPEGGPLISIGDKFNGLIVDHFDKDLNVYMKKKIYYKIAAMSDLHGYLPEQIEKCDIVCISGDIMPLEIQRNITESFTWLKEIFFPWIENLPCEKVFLIGGNHDFLFDWINTKAINRFARENCYDKLIYLNNTLVEYDNFRIYGCPNVENLEGWAFYTEDKHEFNAIPQCDILLTHMPPKIEGLGYIPKYGDLGSEELKKVADSHKIKLWFCGHMHDGNHEVVEYNGCKLKNVSIKDDNYLVINPITYIDLEV